MAQDESAALGGALQAAWCDCAGRGSETALAQLCKRCVSLDESTRCVPDRKRVALYKESQEAFDRLGTDLRRRVRSCADGRSARAMCVRYTLHKTDAALAAISRAHRRPAGDARLGAAPLQRGPHEHDARGRARGRGDPRARDEVGDHPRERAREGAPAAPREREVRDGGQDAGVPPGGRHAALPRARERVLRVEGAGRREVAAPLHAARARSRSPSAGSGIPLRGTCRRPTASSPRSRTSSSPRSTRGCPSS